MKNDYSHIITHVDAVVHFFQELDLEMIELLLDGHYKYSGLEKEKFIDAVGSLIYRFQQNGDTRLRIRIDKTVNTKIFGYGRRTLSFEGDNSGYAVEIDIKFRDNRVINIVDSEHSEEHNQIINKRLHLRYFMP